MIRSLWVATVGVAFTAIYATWAVFTVWRGPPDLACRCDTIASRWSRAVLWLAGVRVQIEGAERIDPSSPSIVVANHQSWFDVWALLAFATGRLRFVAKEELGRIPIFGRAWVGCGHISLDRGDRKAAIDSLNRAGRRLQDENLQVVLFPEGTRSPDGRLQEFKKGAFMLAMGTEVPIVPVGISGSRFVLPKGSFRVRSGEIRIRVGDPIQVAGRAWADRDELRRVTRLAVAALMEDGDALEVPADEDDRAPTRGGDDVEAPAQANHEEETRSE